MYKYEKSEKFFNRYVGDDNFEFFVTKKGNVNVNIKNTEHIVTVFKKISLREYCGEKYRFNECNECKRFTVYEQLDSCYEFGSPNSFSTKSKDIIKNIGSLDTFYKCEHHDKLLTDNYIELINNSNNKSTKIYLDGNGNFIDDGIDDDFVFDAFYCNLNYNDDIMLKVKNRIYSLLFID
jgi:hypothetical protein